MLSEGKGENFGELKFFKVVAFCDYLGFFVGVKLEHEIFRETVLIPRGVQTSTPRYLMLDNDLKYLTINQGVIDNTIGR
jgi:hypothetical protein